MAKVLVVDDDDRNLRLAITVLEQAGHEVRGAGDGATCMDMVLAQAPDLVLMDIQLPGASGITVLKRLRADPRTASIKVAALTAFAMAGDAVRLLEEGFDGYLEKPIRYKQLLAAVERMLQT